MSENNVRYCQHCAKMMSVPDDMRAWYCIHCGKFNRLQKRYEFQAYDISKDMVDKLKKIATKEGMSHITSSYDKVITDE